MNNRHRNEHETHQHGREERHGRGGHCGHWRMMAGEGGGPFGRGRGGGGPLGRHRGGPFGGRGPRMFDPGALRLVVLWLIGEQPRHGYDIIKALEAGFQGAYSPSPGAIYPMLQMLEEADLVVSEAEGNKRLFRITDAGRAYLDENRADLDRILEQMKQMAGRLSGAEIGEVLKALRFEVHNRLREGTWSAEQIGKARDILERARKEIEGL